MTIARMTSRQRILAALRGDEVDYVPMVLHFWSQPLHPKAKWASEAERLSWFVQRGWDASVKVTTRVSPLPEVRTEVRHEQDGESTILHQIWRTPAGVIEERLRATTDWHAARRGSGPVGLGDDFRTPRYIEFPFKTEDDLEALPYLFPVEHAADMEAMRAAHARSRALADEFAVPLIAFHPAGMDWLTWLFPPEEMVVRMVEQPGMMCRILDHINEAFRRRLDLLLALGVDAVLRRGLYESTDFWSPRIFAECAVPPLKQEINRVHNAGALHIYDMMSGIKALLPQLAELEFDCLIDFDPAYGGLPDLGVLRDALPGKSIWGGISAPEHLGRGSPEETERAVQNAFACCGHRGFILGPRAGIRHDWPWENIEACDRAWRRLRSSRVEAGVAK